MTRMLIFSLFLFSACATKNPQGTRVSANVGVKSLELATALKQDRSETLNYLRSNANVESFGKLSHKDPMAEFPTSILREFKSSALSEDKKRQSTFLRQFRSWKLDKKATRAEKLVAEFSCNEVIESQALGYSLERDFPETKAVDLAMSLHEKVLTCADYPSNESLFRLTAFSLMKNDCSRAATYISKFPKNLDQGSLDRVTYLGSFCAEQNKAPAVVQSNPWGGYGVLLADLDAVLTSSEKKMWHLASRSGDADWDRLLMTLVELTEKEEASLVRHIASKLDYDKFKSLPLEFQTAMLVLFSYNNADLTVFQALHNYLSEHPEDNSAEVAGLLFPIRYWKEIVEFGDERLDPILIKSLIRQESAFNPEARSRVKASGLMQLMSGTARIFGVKNAKELLKPEVNIKTGSKFLSKLVEEFGSVELALAAYNAGPGVVREWVKRYPTKDVNLFVEMIPYTETRAYVRLVLRNYKIYQNVLLKNPKSDLSISQNMTENK